MRKHTWRQDRSRGANGSTCGVKDAKGNRCGQPKHWFGHVIYIKATSPDEVLAKLKVDPPTGLVVVNVGKD